MLERINRGLLVFIALVAIVIVLLFIGWRSPTFPFSTNGGSVFPFLRPVKKVGIVPGHWPDDQELFVLMERGKWISTTPSQLGW